MKFKIHDIESAPEGARQTLSQIEKRYGFVPNLAGVFAASPGALQALLTGLESYDNRQMQLSPLERQVVLLAASTYNRCSYCAAAHGTLADKLGLDGDEIRRLQSGSPLSDARLEALRRFTVAVVDKRGHLDPQDLADFSAAGFEQAHVLEVITGVALKTLTNYANHVADTPVNEQFAAWEPEWSMARA